MKATYKTANGRLMFEVTGENVKDLFSKIGLIQEVFDADIECGCCKSKDLAFRSREVDSFHFYEMVCRMCYARLQFGQAKAGGGLFPKRKAEDGEWLPNRGWSKYGKAKAQTADQNIADSDVPF